MSASFYLMVSQAEPGYAAEHHLLSLDSNPDHSDLLIFVKDAIIHADPLWKIEYGRCLFWADPQEISVRRDQPGWRCEQGRRRDGPNRALRGGAYHADASDAVFQPEALGARSGETSRHEARQGRSCTQTGRRAPSHVGGRHRLSLGGNRNGRLKEEMLIEARLERHASNEVPSLGRGLGKIVCSAVNASANHAS